MVKCRNTKRKIDRGVANVQFTSVHDFKYRAVSPACQFNARRRDVNSEIILLPKQFAVRPNTATDIQDLRTGWCTQMPADKILIYRCGRSAEFLQERKYPRKVKSNTQQLTHLQINGSAAAAFQFIMVETLARIDRTATNTIINSSMVKHSTASPINQGSG